MNMRRNLSAFVLVLFLAGAVLSGCGGSSAGAGKAIDACKLLTQADAEAVLGGPVKAPENPVSGEGLAVVTSCKYRVAAAPSVNNVSVIVRRLDSADAARQDFEQLKKDMEPKLNVTPTDVTSVGDAAFWSGGSVNQLAVLKDKVQLLIYVNGPQSGAPDTAAKTLAANALGRLP
jgi:hypothetical protein